MVAENVTEEPWQVTDLSSLEWALERLAAVQTEIAENQRVAEQSIARIQARTANINANAQRSADFFEAAILAYAKAHKDELLKGGRKKSRALPGGTVGWRRQGGGLKVVDENAALGWAKTQPLELKLVRVKEEVAKSAVNKYFASVGEVPPGFDLEPEVEVAYVKVDHE